MSKKKVFVAMSGGVDSSAAALLMQEAGYAVEGVTMCFSVPAHGGDKPSCCGADSIQDARGAAKILGIPHHVLDFAGDLEEWIMEDFTREYLNGRTPNPCVRCNQYVKFGTLYRMARELGVDALATGHYARITRDPGSGAYELRKGKDSRKDQSYFLYGMARDILPRVFFPLGDLTKTEVRVLARARRLPNAEKPESQDICFVPPEGYKQFIRDRMGEAAFQPGPFKDQEGRVVGEHRGIANYTVGQRDKLGIALGYPVYVTRIDKEENTVYVGPEEGLYASGLEADGFRFLTPNSPQGTVEVSARIRYNAPEVQSRLTVLGEGRVLMEFHQPQKAVTPGQSVVCYQGDLVVGGGIISRASAPPAGGAALR